MAKPLRLMSEILERDEPEVFSGEGDDEGDDGDGSREDAIHASGLRPSPKRRYTRNWISFTDFDEVNNLDQDDGMEKDVSKQFPTENFILKEMAPPPRRNKASPSGTDDSQSANTEIDNENPDRSAEDRPPPIPKKRTNLTRPTSSNLVYDDVIIPESKDVRVEVDDNDDDEVKRHSSLNEKIGDFTVSKRPLITNAPEISIDRRFGPTGLLSVTNPTLKAIDDSNEPMAFTNPSFESDGEGRQEEAAPPGEEQKKNAVHWDKGAGDSGDEKKEEVSDLDRLDWDVFRAYQYDANTYACENVYKVGAKVLKAVFVLISFLLILTCLVTSKLSVLYATSNIHPDVAFIMNNSNCGVPATYEVPGCKSREVVRWLWCVLLCMCGPYVIIFFQSMWKICFKKKPQPKNSALFFTLFMESLHTGGLMILFFIVLPKLDILQSMFLMSATALLPSFFKLFIRPDNENRALNVFLDLFAFLAQLVPVILYPVTAAYDSQKTCISDNANWTTCSADVNNSSVVLEECLPSEEDDGDGLSFLMPIAVLLISCSWWQNFVDRDLRMACTDGLKKLSREVKRGRTKIYAIVAIWKMTLSFGLFLVIAKYYVLADVPSNDDGVSVMALLFGSTDSDPDSRPFKDHEYMDNSDRAFEKDWLKVLGANVTAGFICYFISLNAIQAKVQKSTYSLALVLSTPIALLMAGIGFCTGCEDGNNKMAAAFNLNDLYWNCFSAREYFESGVEGRELLLVLGVVWWLGLFILARHLWSPKSERLAKASRIFVQPFYCGMLLEQSFALNRSRHDRYKEKRRQLPRYIDHVTPGENRNRPPTVRHGLTSDRARTQEEIRDEEDDRDQMPVSSAITEDPLYSRADKTEPMIFICATMWHETEQEMIQMLKSVLRLDRDQAKRRLTREYFQVDVPDYYSFEVHIFFDDAFNKYVPGDPEVTVNRFVAQFVKVIDQAASFVHAANVEVEPPKKVPTPYGGKLIYNLPGGNIMYVHLKDKQKIRHRKRWSQVMYMYYLLGHRLWDQPIRRKVKEEVAYNTYLLTLDGDVDFKPEAVLLLVDLMRRNFGVGAACGRIHPEGNGPMVWYQKFEYAISHWLQKTTEHVLGCVLCSPGCFSMFRASALMDDNVMKTYSKTAEEARHYVQYDQGEDRWLCTLLLQRGYRVEYSAAADALTYAPESFNEFFNQRRRWTPSTFANILDLLSTGRATAKRNQNISILYIIYQGGLMFSSIVGPATIFLMVVSAFNSVFRTISMTGAFFIVFVPVAIFFALCMLAKQSTQLSFAALLGALFATSQMVVFVSLIIGIAEDGLCSPTAWFLLGTSGIFIIAGVLHPQEMFVLVHGLLYFLLIPTMYLLLIIYSLCNLHVVSWGTREVVQTNVEKEKLKQRELELAAKHAQATPKSAGSGILGMVNGLLGGIGGGAASTGSAEDGWTWSCGDCFRCLCCPRPGESPTDKKLSRLEKQIAALSGQISRLADKEDDEQTSESDADETKPLVTRERCHSTCSQNDHTPEDAKPSEEDEAKSSSEDVARDSSGSDQPKIDDSESRPYWTQDYNSVGRGPVGSINEKEENFWKNLIRRYLLPIDKNPEREERIKKELLALRNKSVIAFFMMNILFMVLFMSLAAVEPVKPPEGTVGNETNLPTSEYYISFKCTDPVNGETEQHFIEPIGFAFLIVFGSFLVIQFIGMLFHRLFSLIQVVSSEVLCQKRKLNAQTSFLELTEKLSKMDEGSQTPETISLSSLDSADERKALTNNDDDSKDGDDDDNADDNDLDSDAESQKKEKTYKDVIKRLHAKPKVFKTMDKTFAKRFLALNAEVSKVNIEEEAPEIPEPVIRSRPRLPSIFQRAANVPNMLARAPMERRQSVAKDFVYELRRKQTEIFTPEMEAKIKQRFQISDREIKREGSRVKRLIATSSLLSTDDDADDNTATNQYRQNN